MLDGGGGGAGGHYPTVGDHPSSVTGLATMLGRQHTAATTLARDVHDSVPRVRTAWSDGTAGDAAYTSAGRLDAFVADAPAALSSARTALEDYGTELVRGRATVEELNRAYAALEPAQRRLAAFGDWIEPRQEQAYDRALSEFAAATAAAGFASVADIDAAHQGVRRRVTGARDECGAVLAGLARQIALPGGRPGQSALAAGLVGSRSSAELLARAGLSTAPSSPEEVKRFWDSLSPSERQTMLAADPKLWGNTKGVPVVDRDWANRTVLDQDLARYRQYFLDRGVTPPATVQGFEKLSIEDRRKLGLDNHGYYIDLDTAADELMERYKDALMTERTLRAADLRDAPTFLLAYDADLYHGEGRAAIAFGNPDTAANIALCVPGLESRVSKMDQIGGDALALYKESRRADPASTAVIAWQGYDAPEFDDVMFQDKADAGARLLAADVHGLTVTHAGDVDVTVVAHSYGSTTTGLALQRYGLADDVDQVALIGSPGVGGDARTVSDLHLTSDRLYVGSASRDVVTTTYSQLGHDPSHADFGATRFRAENITRQSGLPWQFDDHSKYYDDATHCESLYALADIATGNGDALDEHGMLAQSRRTETVTTYRGSTTIEVDPESRRTPTSGHQH
ncbi:MAG TPA: alpha/beta hydrolase [Dermatophilaceae bacterium]|nr:alpha/beta hydrolase [Dermatophilaceae bacterium]